MPGPSVPPPAPVAPPTPVAPVAPVATPKPTAPVAAPVSPQRRNTWNTALQTGAYSGLAGAAIGGLFGGWEGAAKGGLLGFGLGAAGQGGLSHYAQQEGAHGDAVRGAYRKVYQHANDADYTTMMNNRYPGVNMKWASLQNHLIKTGANRLEQLRREAVKNKDVEKAVELTNAAARTGVRRTDAPYAGPSKAQRLWAIAQRGGMEGPLPPDLREQGMRNERRFIDYRDRNRGATTPARLSGGDPLAHKGPIFEATSSYSRGGRYEKPRSPSLHPSGLRERERRFAPAGADRIAGPRFKGRSETDNLNWAGWGVPKTGSYDPLARHLIGGRR